MAELLLSVERSLDAGHQVAEVPECEHEGHGHRFIITVTSKAILDAKRASLPSLYDLGAELELTLGELVGKSLNMMMSAAEPTGPNLALWVLERMSARFQKIVEVSVATDPEHRYVVRREIR